MRKYRVVGALPYPLLRQYFLDSKGFFITIGLLFLALATTPLSADHHPITSGSEIDYPPFCIVDADGKVDGFSVELMRASLKAMNREVTFKTGPWAEVRGWLERGEIEALPLVGRTPEREKLFDYTIPYMTLYGAIVVRNDNQDIKTLDDLIGRQVAVMKGDNAEEFLHREDRDISIVTTATFDDALRQLSAGQHDAVVCQRLVALRLISEAGLDNLHVIDKPLDDFSQDFCFAVKEGDRDMLALLNEGLAIVMADGTYSYLHAKWFAALQIPSDRNIIIGGDHNYPPYEYLDDDGHPAGFTVELTRAIALEMGMNIEFKLEPWSEVLDQFESGEIDVIQGMFYSAERDLKYDFSQPLFVNHYVGVTRKGEGPPPGSIQDLIGKRIVVQRGDVVLDLLRVNGLTGQLTLVETHEDMLRELAQGRHDCAIVVRISAMYLIEQNGWKNLNLGSQPFQSMEYCYTVLNGRKALQAQFNEGLRLLDESGEFRRIHDKWLGGYIEDPPNLINALRYSAIVLIPLLLLLLAGLSWSWTLRRQVASKTSELRESLDRFQYIFESANVGKSLTQITGEINPNQALADMLGYTVEELKSLHWQDITHPDDIEATTEQMAPLLNGSQDSTRFEKRYRRKDGKIVWADISIRIRRDRERKPLYFISTVVDITERKKAEDALRERIKELRCLYSIAGVAEKSGISNSGLCQEAVKILPSGWQYPGITGARITLGDQEFSTDNFAPTPWMQQAPITVKDETIGFVQLCYLAEMPAADEGPFLKEERRLINEIAKRLGEHIERQQAEESLRNNQEMLLRTEQIANIGSWEYYIATDKTNWSDGMFRITGLDPAQPSPNFSDHTGFIFPEDLERLRKAVEICISTGAPYELETRLIRPDESIRHVLAYGQAEMIGIKPPRRLFGFLQDITERKKTEEALRRNEEFQRAMIECSPVALYSIDMNGRVESWNKSAERIFGWTAAEIIGKPLPIVPADKQNEFSILREQVLKGEGFFGKELVRIRKDGNEIPISLSVAPIRNDRGETVGVLGAAEDISERMRAQEEHDRLQDQLIQAQKLESIGRLAGGVAHDFNNILQGMMGYSELLLDLLPEGEDGRDYARELAHGVERATTLTRQLLAFARKQTISPKAIDLNTAVENMLKMLRRLIGEDIDLVWHPSAKLWGVKMDPGQVDQILANLCVNARDAINGNGKVSIETGNVTFDQEYVSDHPDFIAGDYVMLAVSDDGCGMDKDTLEKVFEPFFTTKEISHGTGLGLATVYGIVKQNSGFINVYSEVGKGTTFKIYLARHIGDTLDDEQPQLENIPRGRGENVLLVEDDIAIINLGRRLLEGLGYNVLAANSPFDAISLARNHNGFIDLLITDVVMPEMNGRELAQKMRDAIPGIKILFMSGYTADVIAHRGVLEQGVQFIQKPFSVASLATKTRDALDG